jgi:hypothetical protein
VNTRHLEEGVNTPLTSHVSGIHEIRARELDIETCEVASSENARRKVNIRFSGFHERKVPRLDVETHEVASSERS